MTHLLGNTTLDDEQQFFVKYIYECGTTLMHLVNDMMDLHRIEAGKMELENITLLRDDLISHITLIANSYRQNIKSEVPVSFSVDDSIPKFLILKAPGCTSRLPLSSNQG